MKRTERLNALHILLQSRRLIKANEIAEHFGVTERTVYRDIKSLIEADVPVIGEAGVGYALDRQYKMPPIQFNQQESISLLIAGKVLESIRDPHLNLDYQAAINKVRTALPAPILDRVESLENSIGFQNNQRHPKNELKQETMQIIQSAISDSNFLLISYQAKWKEKTEQRQIEPLGLVYYTHNWHLIAWCHLREDYRDFRVDKILEFKLGSGHFYRDQRLSLSDYLKQQKQNTNLTKATIQVTKFVAKLSEEYRHSMGFVEETTLENDWVELHFWTASLKNFSRWIISLVPEVKVVAPEELTIEVQKLAQLVANQFLTPQIK